MNPFQAIRTHFGLAQAEIARSLDVNPQTIMRLEQGLTREPNEATLKYYVGLIKSNTGCRLNSLFYPDPADRTRFLRVSQDGLKTAYLDWQTLTRTHNAHYFRHNVNELASKTTHPFTEWRELNLGPGSTMLLCKLLAIRPQTVIRFEQGTTTYINPDIGNALSDIGWSAAEIRTLRVKVAAYLERRVR